MKRTLVAAIAASLSLGLAAQNIKVFLNNKPFPGKTIGTSADLYVECGPALKILGSDIVVDPQSSEIQLEGKSLTIQNQGGLLLCRAKDLCLIYGGRYDFNKSMGTIDIYAYDPIAKAKEAMQRVMKQKEINSEADFTVITLLSRQYLIQQLGLKLSDDLELRLVNPAAMSKASGRNLDTFVTYVKGKDSGTGSYIFYVKTGNSPLDVLHSLGWAWGVQWQNLNGDASRDDLATGFGDWVAYVMVRDLTKVDESRRSLRSTNTSAATKEVFKQLMDIEHTGGIEAVLAYVKNQSK